MQLYKSSAMMAVNHPNDNNIRHIHFNNAGASPSPPEVTNAIIQHLQLETEVGGYHAASLVNIDKVYSSVARLIGIDNDIADTSHITTYDPRDEIALVESATVGWTRVFYSMLETKERELMLLQHQNNNAISNKKKELVILVSEAEYAANLVAAVKFARDHSMHNRFQWRVIAIPSNICEGDPTGVIDLEAFRSMLKGTYPIGNGERRCINPSSIVMVCITHIPTNAGIINPVHEIGQMIHEYNSLNNDDTKLPNIMYLVDGCQSIGQIQVNVKEMQCHALAATGRKYLRGPRGTGFLYVQKSIANILEPSHIDHAAAPVVRMPTRSAEVHSLEEDNEFGLSHTYQLGARRFEFWESNISTRLGLGVAIDVALDVGMDNIEKKCASLGTKLRQQLHTIQGVQVYHDNSSSCGIMTFSIDDVDATIIKERMQNGVEDLLEDSSDDVLCCFYLSVVPASSTPLDSTSTGLGDRRLLRASLSYFNTEDEIDLFCKALSYLVQVQSVVGE